MAEQAAPDLPGEAAVVFAPPEAQEGLAGVHQVLMTCGLTAKNQRNILINQENFYRIEDFALISN
jgi:hypothetical protein